MTRSNANHGEISQLAHEDPVTREEIEGLVRALLQYDRLLAAAIRAELSENHFNGPNEHVFFVLYYAMRTLYETHGAVTADMLTINIRSWEEHGYVALSELDRAFLFGEDGEAGFIAAAFRPAALDQIQQRAQRQFYEGVLRRFLNARAIKADLQTLVNSAAPDCAPVDPVSILDMFQAKAQKIQHLGAVATNASYMPEFGAEIDLPPPAVPTGVRWIDEFIGGIRDGDLLGLLGPYSGGKTTMLLSATAQIGQMFYNTGQNKVAVFVGYEDNAEKMRHLMWSAFAHIDRNVFTQGVRPWDLLSTRENLKPYDSLLPENRNGEIVLGELERWTAARQWCNDYVHYLDFAASSENASVGKGGLFEVVAALRQIAETTGKEIGFLAIDYAGLMLERYIEAARNAQSSDYSRYLSLLPNALRQSIVNEFHCTILLAHQLAADKANEVPGKYMHHTNAKGCKGFAENLHSCACIGQRDEDSRVSTLHWSKIRAFVPPSAKGLVQISPYYVGVDLVTDDYYVDAMTNRIVRRGDIGSFGGTPTPAPQRPLPQIDRFSDVL